MKLPTAIELIEHNANRGSINKTPEHLRQSYFMEFDLTDGDVTTHHKVEFQANDDRHASNKANFLLRIGVEALTTTYSGLLIYRGQEEVPDLGLCTCPAEGEPDKFCPEHGKVLMVPYRRY